LAATASGVHRSWNSAARRFPRLCSRPQLLGVPGFPCQREAALLASAAAARRGRVVFVGVDVNDVTSDARHFLRTHRVPYVGVHSKRSIADRFGLIGLPETFYVDRWGRIQDITRGELSAATLQRALARASQN
jgi:hypothetical protein